MSSSFFSNMSQWIIGIQPDTDDEEIEEIKSSSINETTSQNPITKIDSTNDEILAISSKNNESSSKTNQRKSIEAHNDDDDFKILDDAAVAAINLAKNIGGSIFNIGKLASEQLYNSAVQIKNIVENTSIVDSFTQEQDKFVNDIEKTNFDRSTIVVPPWFGFNEEAIMKTLILGICNDKNNFLIGPDSDDVFCFDYDSNYPTAMLMLNEDPMLERMRFKLVPKILSEKIFWRNYFYKILLIKQSVQLSSIDGKTEQFQSNLLPTFETKIVDDKNLEDNHMLKLATSLNDLNISQPAEICTNQNLSSNTNQLADWEQELVAEMSNDPMVFSDAVKIPEDLENELIMELQQQLTSQAVM